MRVIEFNDAGLVVADRDNLRMVSPGYAVTEGRDLRVGDAARARARLNPRRAHNHFWYQLDQQPLENAMGHARNNADLAFAHVQSLGAAVGDAPVLLAVPGTFDRAQLGLLLGLVRTAQLKAVGLVDSAVAAASLVETQPLCLHLDVQLHRFVLTRLDGGGQVVRQRVDDIVKPGLAVLYDRFAAVIAEAFVRQTRFDPLHGAHTEQALYDRLPDWLATLSAAPGAVLEMSAGNRGHRISLQRDTLSEAVADCYAQIAAGLVAAVDHGGKTPAQASLLVSHRITALPGLIEFIESECGLAATRLDAQAVTRGALTHAAQIRCEGNALAYVTRLPGRVAATAAVHTPAAALPRPTHVLLDAHAYPLPDGRVRKTLAFGTGDLPVPGVEGKVSLRDGQLWLECPAGSGTRVNGEPVAVPRTLVPGDRIEIGGRELQLIVVVGTDEART